MSDRTEDAGRRFAGLAGDDRGVADERCPLVLLHGLTFDRAMWGPGLSELEALDPHRRVLVLDLPGHGSSPGWESYGVEAVAEAVHRAVQDAGLDAPVVVGHSLAAIVASIYAGRYPASGVVNVDQSMQTAPFAKMLQSMAEQLRGPGFADIWPHILASMHVELLPPDSQVLVRSTCRPDQRLVLGYWSEALERPAEELDEVASQGLAQIRAAGLPYHIVAGAEPDETYKEWLRSRLPQASITVWPGSGHFPHLAEPRRFAEVLSATACWPTTTPSQPNT